MRRGLTIAGGLLALAGIVALLVGGITFTRNETLVQVGDAKIETEKKDTISIPPIVAFVAIGGGVVLLVAAAATKRG